MFRKKWMVIAISVMLALLLPISNLAVSAEAFSDGEAVVELADFDTDNDVSAEEFTSEVSEFVSEPTSTNPVMTTGVPYTVELPNVPGVVALYEYVDYIPEESGYYSFDIFATGMSSFSMNKDGEFFFGPELSQSYDPKQGTVNYFLDSILFLEAGEVYTFGICSGDENVNFTMNMELLKFNDIITNESLIEYESSEIWKPMDALLTEEYTHHWYRNYSDYTGIAEGIRFLYYNTSDSYDYFANEDMYCICESVSTSGDRYLTIFDYKIDRAASGFYVPEVEKHFMVEPGSDILLDTKATVKDGYNLAYVWHDLWLSEVYSTDSTLTVQNVTEDKEYVCDVSDGGMNFASIHFYIHTSNIFELEKNVVTETYIKGQNVSLFVPFKNLKDENLVTCKWYKKNAETGEYDFIEEKTGNTSFRIDSAEKADYLCEVTDVIGNTQTVNYSIVYPKNTFYIDGSIEYGRVIEPGESVKFEIYYGAIYSGEYVEFTWYKVDSSTGEYVLIEGEDKSYYEISDPKPGKYVCIVSDGMDTTKEVTFHLLERYFTKESKEFLLDEEWFIEGKHTYELKPGECRQVEFTPDFSGSYEFMVSYEGGEVDFDEDSPDLDDPALEIYEGSDLKGSLKVGHRTKNFKLTAGKTYTLNIWCQDGYAASGVGKVGLTIRENFETECDTFAINGAIANDAIWFTASGREPVLEVYTDIYDSDVKLSYKWYKWDASAGKFNVISGEKEERYYTDGLEYGNYYCKVSDNKGNSLKAHFVVVPKNWYINIGSAFMSAEERKREDREMNVVAEVGSSVTLKVPMKKTEDFDMTYTWYLNDKKIAETSKPEYKVKSVKGYMRYTMYAKDQGRNKQACIISINGLGMDESKMNFLNVLSASSGQKVTLTAYLKPMLMDTVCYEWYDGETGARLRKTGDIANTNIKDSYSFTMGSKKREIDLTIKAKDSSGKAQYLDIVFEVNPGVSYQISYNANGGSGAPAAQYKASGQTLTLSSTKPTRKGYKFLGWAASSNATSAEYKAGGSYKANSEATLYAVWEANTYTIAYYKNGGSGSMKETTATYGQSKTLRSNSFTKKGYSFAGWNTKRDGSGTTYKNKASVKNLTSTNGKKISLYAQWKANPYKIAYYKNGGSGSMNESKAAYDTKKTLRTNSFTRKGYTFAGWNTKRDGSGTSYADKQKVLNLTSTKDKKVSLYAQWTPNTYRVAYYKNGGSGSMGEVIMTYDKSEILQANSFTKEGYVFAGWNTKRDGSGKTYTDQQEVKNLTSTNGKKVSLYAMWEKNPEEEIL